MSLTYKDAGVDNDAKKKCSQIMHGASKQTWQNRKGLIGEVLTGSKQGAFGERYTRMPVCIQGLNADGVGTKMVLAQMLSTSTGNYSWHRGIASDLFAMVCDDAVRYGEPVNVVTTINVNKLHPPLIKELAEGMVLAAKTARVAVVNGEIAELGDIVGGFGEHHYIWDAVVQWVASDRKDSRIPLKAGMPIVGFRECGFRSNGLSLVRKILREAHGEKWYEDVKLAEQVLTPSRIYAPTVVDILGGFDTESKARVAAVVHVTGGGIPEKLSRALEPYDLGANIYSPHAPPEIMLECQKIGGVEDTEAYKTWNMGNGMLIITPEPEKVIQIASEHGIDAKTVGETCPTKEILICNKGANARPLQGMLTF